MVCSFSMNGIILMIIGLNTINDISVSYSCYEYHTI